MDIGVATPRTCTAGNDCCDSMWSEKFRHYRLALPEMAASGIHYVPLIFSCYGRVHPEAMCILENLAKRAARCIGVGDWHSLMRRTRASIGVSLARRCVAMVRACLKPLSPGALNLLLGDGLDEV